MSNNKVGTSMVTKPSELADSCVFSLDYQQGLNDTPGAPGAAFGGAGFTPAALPAASTGSKVVSAALPTTSSGSKVVSAALPTASSGSKVVPAASGAASGNGGFQVPKPVMGFQFNTGIPSATGLVNTVPKNFCLRSPVPRPMAQPSVKPPTPVVNTSQDVPYYDFTGRFVEIEGQNIDIDGFLSDPSCPEEMKNELLELYKLQNPPISDPYAGLREKVRARLAEEQSKCYLRGNEGTSSVLPLSSIPPRQSVLRTPTLVPSNITSDGKGAIPSQANLLTSVTTGAKSDSKEAQAPPTTAAGTKNGKSWEELTTEERKESLKERERFKRMKPVTSKGN